MPFATAQGDKIDNIQNIDKARKKVTLLGRYTLKGKAGITRFE
jgi:hypothetical protein